MGRKEEHPGLQDQCRFEEIDDADAWVSAAWNKRRDERTSWAELGREFDRDWRTVRVNVSKYSKLVADAYRRGDVDALADYLEGLQDDKRAQLEAAAKAQTLFVTKDGEVVTEPDWRTRVAARKEVTAIREKIAAAQGVVTERKGTDLNVSGGLDLALYGNLSEPTRDEIRAVAEGRVFGESDDGSADQTA